MFRCFLLITLFCFTLRRGAMKNGFAQHDLSPVPAYQFQPCAFRTAIIVERMSRHVCGFSIVSFENMQPSQLTCCVLRVTSPRSSRSHRPAARTMSILPLGSFGRQWRPVLSCEPEPLTVASFCATWKSFTQWRRAPVILPSASYNNSLSDQS